MSLKENIKKRYAEYKEEAQENREFERKLKKKRILAEREARMKAVSDFERAKVAARKKALLKQYNQKLNQPKQSFSAGFMTGDVLGVRSPQPTPTRRVVKRRTPTRKVVRRKTPKKRITKRRTTKRKVRRRAPAKTASTEYNSLSSNSYF